MPDARAFTPNYNNVIAVADAALLRPEGVSVVYGVAQHGSLAACEHLARGFQQSFTSLRARSRRLSEKRLGEVSAGQAFVPRDSMAVGPYDSLMCQRTLLADNAGWTITLAPSVIFLNDMQIIDNATGLPLAEIGKDQSRLARIFAQVSKDTSTITVEDWDYVNEQQPISWLVDPKDPESGYWLPRPTPVAPKVLYAPNEDPDDLANLNPDDMFGSGLAVDGDGEGE